MEAGAFDTGSLIKKLRDSLNLTQDEFASEMGVGRTTIIRYETNKALPDAEFLLKLNFIFKVDPTYVLTGRMPVPTLAHEETCVLDAFRHLSGSDRSAILRICMALAKLPNH